MAYDGIHNILSKTQVHEIVQPATVEPAIPQRKTSYDWTYAYTGTQPHAPSHIGLRTFLHDANGNQTGWDHDTNGANRRIVWDEENRVLSGVAGAVIHEIPSANDAIVPVRLAPTLSPARRRAGAIPCRWDMLCRFDHET